MRYNDNIKSLLKNKSVCNKFYLIKMTEYVSNNIIRIKNIP